MQQYIDALVAHADKAEKLAAHECEKKRKALKEIEAKRTAVVAKIIGVPVSEVVAREHYADRFTVKRWPGIRIDVEGAPAWKAHEAAEQAARAAVRECCEALSVPKGLKGTSAANKLRAFIRARYGAKPKVAPSAAIAAFLDANQPVACKVD